MLPLKDHNPAVRIPFVTFALVAINMLAMLWLATLSPLAQQEAVIEHGFIPARIEQLSNPRLQVRVRIEAEPVVGRGGHVLKQTAEEIALPAAGGAVLLSALTCMFLHGGWLHLAGNMWFLWIFGNNIEDRLGHVLYLIFYLVGGLVATACHWLYDPQSMMPVVGASGAVAAVLGAYAVTYPKHTISTLVFFGLIVIVEIPALAWLAVWFGGQLFSAYLGQDMGVAVWAHIGGFVFGAGLMPLLARITVPPALPESWQQDLRQMVPPPERHDY